MINLQLLNMQKIETKVQLKKETLTICHAHMSGNVHLKWHDQVSALVKLQLYAKRKKNIGLSYSRKMTIHNSTLCAP